MSVLADFGNGKAHCRPQLFKVLANFVYGDAALLCGVPTQLQGRLDLFPEDSFQPNRQWFAQFQTEAHRTSSLLVSESHVAVAFFPSHFPSKPGRRLESSAADAVGEFHFCHHETGVSTLININLNNYIFPGNFAAHLAQSSAGGSRPKRIELFWAEPDLAFFPVCTATDLESQRCGRALFAETDLSACGLTRQITLIDNVAPRAFQFIGQPLKQKFAFDFPIVCCASIFLHKANMLNAMSLLSRFSRWRENQMDRVVLSTLPGFEDKIHAGIADAGCKRARLA
jgi:hypothetical protein